MKRIGLLVAAALAAFGVAQARDSEVPQPVIDAVQLLVAEGWLPYDPEDPENSGPPPPAPDAAQVRKWRKSGLLKKINITPGAAPDWLIDTEKTRYPAAWCGSGGCLVEIWSPDTNGSYVKIFSNQIRHYKVRPIPGEAHGWLETDFHGSQCGRAGVEPCPWGFEWRDDGLSRYALRSSWRFAKGEVLHTGPAPQALDPMTEAPGDTLPEPLQTVIAANTKACGALGGAASDSGLANRLPDLNGDGIDDWSYDGAWIQCHNDSANDAEPLDVCGHLDCTLRIWVSRRNGAQVTWQPVVLAPASNYGLVYRPNSPLQLVELRRAAGVEPGSNEACDTFVVRNCIVAPISLSPSPPESPTTP